LFDRKLICFSPRIKKCPFYDERWIKVIKSCDELNEDMAKWLLDDTIIPNYKNKEYCLSERYANEIIALFKN
jgi:hypothetical protein